MASFYSMLNVLAVDVSHSISPGSFDILSALPVEIATAILRLLPGKDLHNVILVNNSWYQLCKSDRQLRRKIRRHFRQLRRARLRLLTDNDYVRRNFLHVEGPTRSVMGSVFNTSHQVYKGYSLPLSARFTPYNAVASQRPSRRINQIGKQTWSKIRL